MPEKLRDIHWSVWAALLLSGLGYVWLGYFTQREDFGQLLSLFAVLFGCYAWILYKGSNSLLILLSIALLFRALLLFSFPNLSDDIYRFIWDGHLVAAGENPYMHTPGTYMGAAKVMAGINPELYTLLNSPGYYTVYPPVNQFIFTASVWFFPGNWGATALVIKCFVLLAETGSVILLFKLLKHFKMDRKHALIYAFNPLVIIELTGNVHFEVFVIFFLLLGVWLLTCKRTALAGVAIGFAICSKLLPLMFLPFVIRRLGWKKSLLLFSVTGITCIILFLPFLDKQLIANLTTSIDLYFQKFEFNASIYYIIRWIGFRVTGYNIIGTAGIWLGGVAFLTIIALAFWERQKSLQSWLRIMLFVLAIYFLLATTVHPWYITTLVAVSVFTRWRFALLWSAVAVLSYAAYSNNNYEENLWLVAVEYIIVIGWLFWEIRHQGLATLRE